MSLVTETNQQYYQGAQVFLSAAVLPTPVNVQTFTTTFNTDLVFGSYDPAETNYALNNFKLYTSSSGLPCLLYTSPSPRDRQKSRMPSSA